LPPGLGRFDNLTILYYRAKREEKFYMGLHYDLPVYKACYDLLLEIFQFTKDFTKEYKYMVGENLNIFNAILKPLKTSG